MKRHGFLLLSMCMLLMVLPNQVFAQEQIATSDTQARYQTEVNGAWINGSFEDALAGVYDGGRIELLEDVELEHAIIISKHVTLTSSDVNQPAKLSYQSTRRDDFLLTIKASEVTLENIILDGGWEDGKTAKAELVAVTNKGSLIMNNGAVLQNNKNVDNSEGSSGFRVISGSAVMNEGSLITNCIAPTGGAVTVSGSSSFVLNGGIIENCQSLLGGGVYVQLGANVYFYKGTIRNNEAKKKIDGVTYSPGVAPGKGGGVFVRSGVFSMLGGVIEENSAEGGGGGIGIYHGIVKLAGGTISKNFAQAYGGGLMAYGMTKTSKGEIALVAYVAIGETPMVSGNSSGEPYFEDIYLDGMEDQTNMYITQPMTIGAPLSDDAEIGISRWLRPDDTHPYRIVAVPGKNYTITKSDLAKFTSNNPAYVCRLLDGNIVLTTEDYHIHDWEETWQSNETAHWHLCAENGCPISDETQKDGYGLHIEDEGTIVKAPTIETTGLKEYRCTICNHLIRSEELPKLPHVHDWEETWQSNETAHWHLCAENGCPISDETQKDGYGLHIEDEGTIVKAPTIETTGLKEYRCTICNHLLRSEELAKLSASDTTTESPSQPETLSNDDNSNKGEQVIKNTGEQSIDRNGILLMIALLYGGMLISKKPIRKNNK